MLQLMSKFSIEARITGVWIEPFNLRNFALVDPAVGIGIGVLMMGSPVTPLPGLIMFESSLYWRTGGEWRHAGSLCPGIVPHRGLTACHLSLN